MKTKKYNINIEKQNIFIDDLNNEYGINEIRDKLEKELKEDDKKGIYPNYITFIN